MSKQLHSFMGLFPVITAILLLLPEMASARGPRGFFPCPFAPRQPAFEIF